MTELIAACAFNATANGVGQFSFTNALVIELIELSRKPSFSVGALYSNIFIRTQCRLPEHGRERHPAPVHLMLTRQMNFHRSIQISVRLQPQNGKEQLQVPATLLTCGGSSGEVISSDPSGQGRGSNVSCMTGIKTASSLPSDADSTSDCRIISTGDQVPRLLFAIRLKESFQPSELSTDLFCEWLRMIPLVVEEVKVEAGFNSFSSLLIVSLPIALSSYIPKNPAVICLGPITSTNMILQPLNRLFSTQSPSSSSRSPPRPAKTPPSTPPRVGAHIVSRAPTKIAVVEGTSMKTSLGLSPYPRKYPSGGAFSKTDLIPVNNSPITVFYQRDDGTQQSILHNVIRTKSATQNNSDQPELGSEQQSRQSTQNVSDRACELGNVIGRYNQSVGNSGLIELDDLSSNHERLAPPRRRSTWMNRFRAVSINHLYITYIRN